jgi:hypothetical protein
VIAGNIGDDLPLPRSKTEKIGMTDQVIGMLVVARVIDEVARIMQQGSCLEDSSFTIPHGKGRGQSIEEIKGESGNLAGMFSSTRRSGEVQERHANFGDVRLTDEAVFPEAVENETFLMPLVNPQNVAEELQAFDNGNTCRYPPGQVGR